MSQLFRRIFSQSAYLLSSAVEFKTEMHNATFVSARKMSDRGLQKSLWPRSNSVVSWAKFASRWILWWIRWGTEWSDWKLRTLPFVHRFIPCHKRSKTVQVHLKLQGEAIFSSEFSPHCTFRQLLPFQIKFFITNIFLRFVDLISRLI